MRTIIIKLCNKIPHSLRERLHCAEKESHTEEEDADCHQLAQYNITTLATALDVSFFVVKDYEVALIISLNCYT